MSSKKLKKQSKNFGIEEEYFPFRVGISPLSKEDLAHSLKLTPSQRIEWLLMMQKLLILQFSKKKIV